MASSTLARNPHLELVQAFERGDLLVLTRVEPGARLGVRPFKMAVSDLSRAFRDRLKRTLNCPNFQLGGLFSADESAGTITQGETEALQGRAYAAIAENRLRLPYPVCSFSAVTPNRSLTQLAILDQGDDGTIRGHAFFKLGGAQWTLCPLVQEFSSPQMIEGAAASIESHLETYALSDDSVVYVDMAVHFGIYAAEILSAQEIATVETSRDRDVAAHNSKSQGKGSVVPHPRIIRIDRAALARIIRQVSRGGTHASPAGHVRRGHWRSKPGGNG